MFPFTQKTESIANREQADTKWDALHMLAVVKAQTGTASFQTKLKWRGARCDVIYKNYPVTAVSPTNFTHLEQP